MTVFPPDTPSYDLDGVLAYPPPQPLKPWGRMTGTERNARRDALLFHYEAAEVLWRPDRPFVVVTARKGDERTSIVTRYWLEREFNGDCLAIYMLDRARTIRNVIAFKSETLRSLGLRQHYEDNPAIVRGLRRALPGVDIVLFQPLREPQLAATP